MSPKLSIKPLCLQSGPDSCNHYLPLFLQSHLPKWSGDYTRLSKRGARWSKIKRRSQTHPQCDLQKSAPPSLVKLLFTLVPHSNQLPLLTSVRPSGENNGKVVSTKTTASPATVTFSFICWRRTKLSCLSHNPSKGLFAFWKLRGEIWVNQNCPPPSHPNLHCIHLTGASEL